MEEINNQTQSEAKPVTVVGLGASAGGLAALKTFFSHMPDDSGMAFVIVVHLSPEHESHLADLLQPHVSMPVQQVTETMKLEPNQVYVIPPGRNLNTIDTHLRLSDLEERRRDRAPIDHFFRTLAATHDGSAIGIILTGTGSDGTLGIKEIKGKGGLIIVQDPLEAEYDGMPQSAIATGMVDWVLSLEEMPAHILRFIQTEPQIPSLREGKDIEDEERYLLQKILTQVRARTARDFSRYKRSTIMRRLQRRMQLNHIEKLEDYLGLLRERPEEVQALSDDFLITVTSFFRDTEVFHKLEQHVIPELFKEKGSRDSVRVWSVGCATGEEAYSLAILLLEEAARHEAPPTIQVFASDLHEHSLQKARDGIYPGDIETDISPERLRRFFVKEDSSFRVRKEVRETVIFTPHNLMSDPPFSKVDLIACRNVMIYLQREIQKDIIDLFHYSLNTGAYLLLGTSETIETSELFRIEDKGHCLYRKRNVPVPEPRLPVFPLMRNRLPGKSKEMMTGGEPMGYGVLHQRMVERYAPPSLLVNPDYQVVHLSEHVGRYLVHPGGEPTTSVFKLVREEFRIELRSMLHSARENGAAIHSKPISIQMEGGHHNIIFSVYPSLLPHHEDFFLVIFEEWQAPESSNKASGEVQAAPADTNLREVETELALTKQRLQAIIEEYETSQEEMKASNEEMQSANEELRSTLEELETSKEELQSVNEELTTVNQENRHKVEELAQLSSDLNNLLKATDIATLFLDRHLRILRFTPRLGELFNVRVVDRGRPLSDITHRLGYDELISDAQKVLDKLVPVEREVKDEENHWYLTRVLPYRSGEDKIEGVVITFVDITERKQAEEKMREAKDYAESIIDTLHEPLLVLKPNLRIQSANQAFYNHFQVRKNETVGQRIYDLGNGQWNIPDLKKLLEEVLPENHVFNDYEVTHNFEDIGFRVMLLNARRLDQVQLVLLGIRDITEKKQSEETLRKSEARLQKMVNIEGVGVLIFDASDTLLDANNTFLHMFGYTREEIKSGTLSWRMLTPPEYIAVSEQQLRQMEETGRIGPYEKEYLRKDGSRSWMLFAGASLGDGTLVEYCLDISDRKQAEEELRQSEERLRRTLGIETVGVIFWDADFRIRQVNQAFLNMAGFSHEEVEGLTWQELTPEEFHEASEQAVAELEEKGQSTPYEKQYFRKDGSRWWGLFAGLKISEEEMVEFVLDISGQKQAEEAIRQNEEHLRLILESAIDYAIFTMDMQGKVTGWNTGAEQIFGYTKEEIIGQPGDILFTMEDREQQIPEKEMEKAKEQSRADNERWHVRKDGSRFWGSGVTMPLRDGNVRGFLKIMRDHTERVQMEEDLRQAKEQAEQSAKAKEDFLAHMSHEIRTPLNAVIGLSHLLLQRDPRADQQENLQSLMFSSQNLMMLVNDILDFSKLQVGKVSIEETEVNLPVLLNSLQKTYQSVAKEKDNQLVFDIDEALPAVIRTDQLRLSQVLNNLISNALKFTHQGQVTVEASLNRQEGDRLWVDFSVTDTGIGIPEDKLPDIFDAFTQADLSTVRQYGGTGLGLTITKLLLELMGSQIAVESKVGKGTRFFFTLPVKESSATATSLADMATHQENEAAMPQLRLLLVEDVDINRMVVKQFLQEWWTLTPDEAADGKQAVVMAQQTNYDLILMDVRMPLMDGYEAAKEIRALKGYKKVPIIALTADTTHEVEKHQEATLFTDIITKPVDPTDLRQKLIRYASGRKKKPSAEVPAGNPTHNHAAVSAASTVDIHKVVEFFKDKERLKVFYEKSIRDLHIMQQEVATAMAKQDEEALGNMIHKAHVLLDMLSLQELKALLEQGHALVREKAPQAQIEEVRQQVDISIKQVIASLEEHLKQLS